MSEKNPQKRRFRLRRRKPYIKRPRPEKISVPKEAYLRFLDFFEGVFPPPAEFGGSGEAEGVVEMSTNRIPVLLFYAPFFYTLFVLTLIVTYPFFLIAAAIDTRRK